MAQAPAINETLTADDAIQILEEILPAQNRSYVLGMKLQLPQHVVDAIHSKDMEPERYLLKVINEFLNQLEPRPTWRVIVDALRSPVLRLNQLANEVEAAHFPNSTTIREVVPTTPPKHRVDLPKESTHFSAPTRKIDGSTEQLRQQKSPESSTYEMTSRNVQTNIRRFEKRFNELKRACRASLKKCKVTVSHVVDALTDLPADDVDEHKQFIQSHIKILYQSSNHSELFGTLSFNMNYLSYQLLEYIADEFKLKIRKEIKIYKKDLQEFRKNTPLILFCHTQKRHVTPPADFQQVVVKFEWPQNHDEVTLEVVEQFRQKYACHYKLRDCAMMLADIRPSCFIVTWYIPQSIVERLRAKIPREILKKYDVTKLEIAGSCVYRLRNKPQKVHPDSESSGSSDATVTAGRPRATSHETSQKETVDEDYPFIEQPSDDFFCPVTFGLLLQPHLTSCCGKHLSQEATARIKREGGACPLCNSSDWSTILSKHFQRQVNSLHVFCRHEDRGCGWHGELSDLERHVLSCPMADTPLMTDLLKSSLYKDGDKEDNSTTTEAHSHLVTAKPYSMPPQPKSEKLNVQCHPKNNAPYNMMRGSATTDQNFAYFIPAGINSVYSYEWNTEQWKMLPSCPYSYSALVIIDDTLTTVGGGDYMSGWTNKLFTLRQRQWVEEYPPMNTARCKSTVVSTSGGDYIIVIGGGISDGSWAGAVELFQVKTRRWYELTNTPKPLILPSATISGNQLHVIGYFDDKSYTCTIENLPSDDQPITSQSLPHLISWTPLPSLPVAASTAATLHGQLVIIGGKQGGSEVKSIHQLVDGEWVEIGSMSSGRRDCLAVEFSDRIMIVGGWGGYRAVEECVLLQ